MTAAAHVDRRTAGLRDKLKAATADLHSAIESLPLLANLTSRLPDRGLLLHYLQLNDAWLAGAEASLWSMPGLGNWLPDLETRRQARRHDLALLSLANPDETASRGGLPALEISLHIPSLSAAFGSLYVLEGSTLGGCIIAANLRRHAWIPLAAVNSFLPYGPRPHQPWIAFSAAMERFVDSQNGVAADLARQEAIEGARHFFSALQTLYST